jgi:hypothetical protein
MTHHFKRVETGRLFEPNKDAHSMVRNISVERTGALGPTHDGVWTGDAGGVIQCQDRAVEDAGEVQ